MASLSKSFFLFFFFFFLLLSTLLLTYPSLCLSQPRAGISLLMAIKASLDPRNLILSSWSPNATDPCKDSTFEGVACNGLDQVVNISLQGKGLYGKIPPEIGHIKTLSGLYLHFNHLHGHVPREIANLNQLSDLYLSFNQLSGSIPSQIGNMSSLQVATIHGSEIEKALESDTYPTIFAKRIVATSFQGLSLTTQYDSSIELNPGISPTSTLEEWKSSNTATIEHTLQTKQFQDPLSLFVEPEDFQKILISEVVDTENEEDIFWVEGQVKLLENEPDPLYIGCGSCNRKVDFREGITFKCMQCGDNQARTIKRFKTMAQINDGITALHFTIFTREIQKIIQALELNTPLELIRCVDVNKALESIKVIAAVKLAPISYQTRAVKVNELPNHPPLLYQSVLRLELCMRHKDLNGDALMALPCLLKSFPLLEKLYLKMPYQTGARRNERPMVQFHANLKEIEFGYFGYSWVEFATYLLSCATVLERMVISRHQKSYIGCGKWSTSTDPMGKEEAYHIYRALQGKAASPNVNVIIR